MQVHQNLLQLRFHRALQPAPHGQTLIRLPDQELCLSGWDSKMRRFCKRVLKDGHNQHTITCVLGLGLGRVVNRTRNGPFITGYILSERSTSNTSLGF